MNKWILRVAALLLCIALGLGVAQETTGDTATDEGFSGTGEGSEFLVLAELALGAGWPGYQLYNVNFAFQKDVFGLNFRTSWTEAGPYVSLAGRYFTPIPIPAPTFVSAGGGYFAGSPVGFATFGAQIPFGLESPFMATVEAGGSVSTNFSGDVEFLPMVSLTVGYTFFLDTTPLTEEEKLARELARDRPAGCTVTEPDYSTLGSTFSRRLDAEIKKAKVKYAGVYSSPSYSVKWTSKEESEGKAVWKGTWTGSAKEVLTGNTISGSGTVEVKFNWNGCNWSLSYSLN
ncbi:MAG: hypothetical protein KC422_08295 [Trueperaceae bacterium]|nr:hypothetical protein [Trueperaceae bacterium]